METFQSGTKQLVYSPTRVGTYYAGIVPTLQQTTNFPITPIVPYTLTLETYCSNDCGINPSPICSQLNCTAIQYATPIEGDTSTCACITNFVFNSDGQKLCIINCALVAHATTLVSGTVDTC